MIFHFNVESWLVSETAYTVPFLVITLRLVAFLWNMFKLYNEIIMQIMQKNTNKKTAFSFIYLIDGFKLNYVFFLLWTLILLYFTFCLFFLITL